MIEDAKLWVLVDKWRESAVEDKRGPYLNPNPVIAFGQALTTAAEELSDLLLADGDE